MKNKISTITFEELPDVITYLDYAEWVGCGINNARNKFNSKGFPLLKGFGNKKKANKYQVFLFDIEDDKLKETFAKEFAKQMIGR